MAIGDRLRGFFGNVKDRFVSIGDKIRGRIDSAKTTIGTLVREAPANIEKAIAFVGKQAITVSKYAGEASYNVIRNGAGKAISETVGDTLNSSFWSGPVILGGVGLAGLLAFKAL